MQCVLRNRLWIILVELQQGAIIRLIATSRKPRRIQCRTACVDLCIWTPQGISGIPSGGNIDKANCSADPRIFTQDGSCKISEITIQLGIAIADAKPLFDRTVMDQLPQMAMGVGNRCGWPVMLQCLYPDSVFMQ